MNIYHKALNILLSVYGAIYRTYRYELKDEEKPRV